MEEFSAADLQEMNEMFVNTLGVTLGMKFTVAKPGYMEATMPVDARTHQPYGLLHGGASVALAESLGSLGSHLLVKDQGKGAVGVEINANHLRSKRHGIVTGKARIVHQGGKIHVWQIDIVDEEDKMIATSRLTVMIIPAPKA